MKDKKAAATGLSRPVQPPTDRSTPDRDPAVPPTPPPPTPPSWRRWLWPAVAAFSLLLLFTPNPFTASATSYTYSQFAAAVTANQVKQVSINPDGAVTGTLTNGSTFHSQLPTALGDTGITASLQAHHVAIVATATTASLLSLLIGWVPYLLLIGFLIWTSRTAMKGLASGIGGFGRARTKVVDAERPTTRFADVAGYAGAKREIQEVVDYLSDPSRYDAVGATGPRGVLLVGPPGTGKTLLARAVAGEAKVPFLSVSGSGFVEMFVGVGASRVRDLFAEARRRAPAIIFIDEIDAIGGRRGAVVVGGGHDEREQTLNQLLAEMDGFEQATGVVVIAATNRPETLDAALLRPGRFDRQVVVALPTLVDRVEILKVHTAGKPFAPTVDLSRVARSTPGFSGADLANLVNEAAIHAVRAHRQMVEAGDISAARDRILIGRREDSNVLLPEEKHAVAVHEAGHALVALLSPNADPVDKVTILPAGAALGVTQQLPEVERHLYSESYLRDSLAVRLGGRAAELVVFGEGSTGAADDLAGATELATRMVSEFGLSKELGPVSYGDPAQRYLPGQPASRPVSEATQCVIDIEVAELMRAAESTALELLTTRRDVLDELTALLLEEETIDGDQVLSVLNPPMHVNPKLNV